MKQISILAVIILLIAAVVFFLRDKGARAELQNAEKQVATLSNEVAKVNTIMMMHNVTNSELKKDIAKTIDRLTALSNRVAKAGEDLKEAQQEHKTLQTRFEQESKKARDAEMRAAQLDGEVRAHLTTIEGRNAEIARLTPQLREAQTERAEFEARMQQAEAEVVRLQLDHTDPIALRTQLDRLKKQWPPNGYARLPKHSTRTDDKGATALAPKVDRHANGYYLQIQQDGTLRVVPPLEAAGAGGAR